MAESSTQASGSPAQSSASVVQKLALPALIAMVVGSMIGSGIFTLPDFEMT
jgi:amino acid transporter